jgi:hypothetical protein
MKLLSALISGPGLLQGTFSAAIARMQAILAAFLSSNALYPVHLGILAAAVMHHFGGMVVAEDILHGDRCQFYSQNPFRWSKRPGLRGGRAG